jgi:hypothetical protein
MTQLVPYALRDWSNRLVAPIGSSSGYSAAEFAARRGADAYLLGGVAVFHPDGYGRALELTEGAPIFAYVHVLHTFAADVYGSTWSEFRRAEGELLAGTALLDADGVPSLRWKAEHPAFDLFNTDPDRVDAVAWAELIASFVARYRVAGLFLDYLSEAPYTYPGAAPAVAPNWQNWQARAVFHLRRACPAGTQLVANGPWAVREPLWTRSQMLDGVFLEAGGTLWGTLERGLLDLRAHAGLRIFDSPDPAVGAAVAAATSWFWSENWRRR